MPSVGYPKLVVILVLVFLLGAPAAAHAWTVTVHVHGAGEVDETTDANLLNCSVSPSGKSESSVTDCVGGSSGGPYSSGWIVDLNGLVTVGSQAYNRGWRFQKWVDGTSPGQINCDPQDQTGDQFSPTNCKFQIFQNLAVDLYFEDVSGPQDTAISGGPAQGSRTNSTSASFSFSAASDPDSTFQCKLDPPGGAGSFGSCPSLSTFNNLTANGVWTLSVRGVDPTGNVDTTPASRSWTVDTVAPTVGIAGSPAASSTTNSTSAGFTLSPSETVNSLMCKLDRPGVPGSYAACGSTTPSYSNLTTDGTYTFSTYAVDQAGNTGTAATRTWTVDTTPPDSAISAGPSGPTSSTTAAFDFSATGGATSYECRLEPTVDWEPCSSGHSYSSLTSGTYTFSVRAIDAVGNVESTPATRTFTVDLQAPDTSIDSGPSGETSSSSATFTFSASEPNSTFECRLDAGPWEACTSGKTYSSLAPGSHTFSVRGRDEAGNQESEGSAATRTWTITSSGTGGTPGGGTPGGGTPGAGTPGGGGTADTTAPVALLSAAKQRLGRVLNKGLVASGSTTEAGRLRLDVLYKGKVVATSGDRALTAPGSKRLVAKFTRKWKRALGRLRSAKLTLRMTATDAAGNKTVRKKTLKLKR
jgi:hypothetical protein